jgi:eukaryotic-like serine/threonine-protein kinase
MDHPNIAKVFDAGATDTGRPYFVMELVRGVPITRFCNERRLSLRERLDLFIQVCRAIQHAHQKGLIHRDIKPSNILVTLNDGVPVPKVIDFGIAKATVGRLTEQTLFTRFEQFLGTPAYMSPEQAEAGGVDIDTRSDIYSLGVVLYELLTGRTPFDSAALLKQGIEELILTLRDVEPPRPSTRLTNLAPADLETVARSQRCEAPKLVPSLRGDLDWIVMKCLEKDRTRRYDTANGLAKDLQRHLDDEPVVARPPSNRYRFQKLVRRNKLAFMALTIVAGLLILGLGAATVAGVRIVRDSQRIRQANTLAIEKLWTSYLSEALARRTSSRAGQRFGTLETLQKAADIRPSLEVRNEAIASLALSDLRLAKEVQCKWPKQRICFDSKLERCALAESDGTITIRAAADDAVLASLPATGSSAAWIRFSPNHQFLMVSCSLAIRDTLWVWNLAQSQPVLKELPGPNGDFSPDSRFLARSNPDGTLSIYDLSSGAEIRRLPLDREFAEVALDSENTRLACRSESGSTVEIVDAASGRTLRALVNASPVRSLGWSPDGGLLATGCLDGRICIWNAATGVERAELEGHTLPPNSIQFNHAGNLLASSSADDTIRLWNLESRRQIVSWPGAGWNIQFSPDDGYLGAITEGSQVGLLQVTTSREFRRLFTGDLEHQDNCFGLDFNADGCILSVGVVDRLQFWNVLSGAEIGSLRPVGTCLMHIFHPSPTFAS